MLCLIFRLLVILVLFFCQACGEGRPTGAVSSGIQAPSDVLAVEAASSITLTWSTEIGLSYEIYWTTDQSLPIAQWQVVSATTAPYSHTNLSNNIPYYYRVAAILDGKKSPLSDVVAATPSITLLRPPENLSVVVGDAQLILSWNEVAGVEEYKIYWTSDESEDPRVSGNSARTTPNTRFLFGGLSNGQAYYFVITSVAGEQESEPTEKVWGIPQLTRPESPKNVTVVSKSNDSAVISWDPSPGAESYRVYWSRVGRDFDIGNALFEEVNGQTTETDVHPLDAGVTYYIRVTALNENGEGAPSVTVEIAGDTPITIDPQMESPTDIKVEVDGVIANISWTTDNVLRDYRLYYATEPGVAPDNYFSLENGTASEVFKTINGIIRGLVIGKTYYLTAISIENGRQSPPSEEITFLVPIPKSHLDGQTIEAGARLYSVWYPPLATPSEFHPLWQEVARSRDGSIISSATAAESWNCSECHGFDYKGSEGQYGFGSTRYTGFPGVKSAATKKTPEEIFNFIIAGRTSTGGDHSFPNIPYERVVALTKFILEATNVGDLWLGNETNGDRLFNTENPTIPQCTDSNCHSQFSDITDLDILPRALEDTAKVVHAIQYGSRRMPGGRSLQDARDVLRYLWMRQINSLTDNFNPTLYDLSPVELNEQMAQGGLLYDRWWLSRAEDNFGLPATNHPLWPESVTTLNGSYTWRCQSCHGWDYRGNNGAYRTGEYFTGINGVLENTGLSDTPADLYNYLRKNEYHAFSFFLPDSDIYALTRLIMQMRNESASGLAPHQIIDDLKQEPIDANSELGGMHYLSAIGQGGCEACHVKGSDSWFFNDISPDRTDLQTVATIAKESPWEFLHKIRFGQPGSAMQGLIKFSGLDLNTAIDVLAYAQTNLDPDIKRGARLYDNWWDENNLNEPLGRHSLWPSAGNILTPVDTWRCVSCHGWDYQGSEGFTGLLSPVRNIGTFISQGTVINQFDHAFSDYLKQQDVADLTAFISDSNEGVRPDINDLLLNGSNLQGQQLYSTETPGNCVNCHGIDGTAIPSVDLKTLASNFAQRFIHVARFGSPGSIMTPGLSRYTGLSAEQAVDVQNYSVGFNQNVGISADIDRGGRLFDNWFVEMKASDSSVQAPVLTNPLWEQRNSTIPDVQSLSDSWRCVSCHNWNYKGRDVIVESPDADNLLLKLEQRSALYPSEEALADYLYNWIKTGTGTQHNYGTEQSGLPSFLGDRELKNLVSFLLRGVLDSSTYIYNLDGSVIDADLVNGKNVYDGLKFNDVNCESCHGVSGQLTPPESSRTLDIFALAKTNPWQFLHKVRFAAPGTAMPALDGIPSTNINDAVDVLGYAQQQFDQRVP